MKLPTSINKSIYNSLTTRTKISFMQGGVYDFTYLILLGVIIFSIAIIGVSIYKFNNPPSRFLPYIAATVLIFNAICINKTMRIVNGLEDTPQTTNLVGDFTSALKEDYMISKLATLFRKDTGEYRQIRQDHPQINPNDKSTEHEDIKISKQTRIEKNEHPSKKKLSHDKQTKQLEGNPIENKEEQKLNLKKTAEGEIRLDKVSAKGNKSIIIADFIMSLKKMILLRNETHSKLGYMKKKLDIAKEHVIKELKRFEYDFRTLKVLSETADEELGSAGIYIKPFLEEVANLEEELINKLGITLNQKVELVITNLSSPGDKEKPQILSGITGKSEKVEFKLVDSGVDPVMKIQSLVKDVNKTKKKMIRTPGSLEDLKGKTLIKRLFLTVEGLISLLLLCLIIVEMDFYVFILRFVLIIMLLINIFTAYFGMRDSQILDENCEIKKRLGCTKNIEQVDEMIDLLKSDAGVNDDRVGAIISEFDKISIEENDIEKVLNDYLKRIYLYKGDIKIFIFENLFDKLKFIEDDFEKITNSKIDKSLFYQNVNQLKSLLEAIKNFVVKIDTSEIIDLHKNILHVKYFFEDERENVKNQINKLIELDASEINRNKNKQCTENLNQACQMSENMNHLNLLLFFGSITFLVGLII